MHSAECGSERVNSRECQSRRDSELLRSSLAQFVKPISSPHAVSYAVLAVPIFNARRLSWRIQASAVLRRWMRAKQREIASKGGRAAHAKGTAHEFTSDEARVAGRKGGEAVSRDRAHMSAIGREGGHSRGRTRQPGIAGNSRRAMDTERQNYIGHGSDRGTFEESNRESVAVIAARKAATISARQQREPRLVLAGSAASVPRPGLSAKISLNPALLAEARPTNAAGASPPGVPGRDRTCDPQLRRLLLYPTELRGRKGGRENWSGREDSNLRPPAPKAGALPDCATPRRGTPHNSVAADAIPSDRLRAIDAARPAAPLPTVWPSARSSMNSKAWLCARRRSTLPATVCPVAVSSSYSTSSMSGSSIDACRSRFS